MDLIKLIESFEELLYRLALWAILIPKTLYFSLRSPGLISRYVSDEFGKSAEDRFKDMLPPVLFWGLVGVAPHLMMIDLLGLRRNLWVICPPETDHRCEDRPA